MYSHKGYDLDEFQLITPSLPGYGKTIIKNNKTPGKAAELIIELMKHLSLNKANVYGISSVDSLQLNWQQIIQIG